MFWAVVHVSCIGNIICAEEDYLASCNDLTKYTHRCSLYGSLFQCFCHQLDLCTDHWKEIDYSHRGYVSLTTEWHLVLLCVMASSHSCFIMPNAGEDLQTWYPLHQQEAVWWLASDRYTASLAKCSLFCNRVFYGDRWFKLSLKFI